MSLGQILFSFSGRINRAKYWLSVVIWVAVWIVAAILITLFVARDIISAGEISELSGEQAARMFLSWGIWAVVFFLVVILPMIISGLAVGIKRLHDRNKSGWWLLLFYIGPSVIVAIGGAFEDSPIGIVFTLASLALMIWAIVELGFLRGTQGPNNYGPDPLAQQPAA